MSRMTDEERRQRENVEQYGPTGADWLEHNLRILAEAVLEPPVRIAAATLRIVARMIAMNRAKR